MPKIEIEVKLSDEDRALLASVTDAAKALKTGGNAEGDGTEDDLGGDGSGDGGDGGDDFGDPEPEVTRDQVQSALRSYATVASKADAMAVLKKHGKVDALSKLKEESFAVVIKAANLAAAKAKKAGK